MKIKRTGITILAAAALLSTAARVDDRQKAPLGDCRKEISLDEIEGMRPREKGETPQGLAISDGVLFALYHGGCCAAIDLETASLLAEFPIDGAAGTHCNNASFGVERADSLSPFPLLYVSECFAPNRCFVEDITVGSSRLVATIIYTGSGIDSFCDWCIDRDNRSIYAYGRTPEKGVVLKCFRLPTLADADENGIIELGDKDIEKEFVYPPGFFGIAQGSHIHNGLLYLPTGVPHQGHCRINIVSLEDGSLIYSHDIDDIALEPEGVCAVGNRLWQFFGGGRGTVCSFEIASEEKKL